MKEFSTVMVKTPPVSLEVTIKYIAMTTPTSEKHKIEFGMGHKRVTCVVVDLQERGGFPFQNNDQRVQKLPELGEVEKSPPKTNPCIP